MYNSIICTPSGIGDREVDLVRRRSTYTAFRSRFGRTKGQDVKKKKKNNASAGTFLRMDLQYYSGDAIYSTAPTAGNLHVRRRGFLHIIM